MLTANEGRSDRNVAYRGKVAHRERRLTIEAHKIISDDFCISSHEIIPRRYAYRHLDLGDEVDGRHIATPKSRTVLSLFVSEETVSEDCYHTDRSPRSISLSNGCCESNVSTPEDLRPKSSTLEVHLRFLKQRARSTFRRR